MRRRAGVLLLGLAALAVACTAAEDGEVREVLVDYRDDQVASSFLLYFPSNVSVRPGDTVVFQQEWTGEPHSVTMGTMVDEAMEVVGPLLEEYGEDPEPPPEVIEQFETAMEPLPWMAADDLTVQQNAAQPCYLDEGGPPEEPEAPCPPEHQEQPPFNGRQSYYNSGFIPYEGPQGNEFHVPLADDIQPGVYHYYCNLHGPGQLGTITVVEPEAEIPSQAEVARQAREEVEAVARPLREAYAQASDGEAEVFGQTVAKPLAGFYSESVGHAFISEFIPARMEIDAGDAVSWHFVGPHTVSFDVPSYFAQVTVADDGTVTFNPEAYEPVNSPGPPEPPAPPDDNEAPDGDDPPAGEAHANGEASPEKEAPSEDGGPPEDSAVPAEDGGPPEDSAVPAEDPGDGDGSDGPPDPVVVDAGEWDGSGFISSGVFYQDAYRLTFTKPGTYPYACLIHPQMVGEVVVR